MLGGFSDSGLGSFSFWLQFLGVAGALGILVSLVGMHLVNGEISGRAHKRVAVSEHPVAAVASEPVATPVPVAKPKVDIALAKPVPPPKPVVREITESQRKAFISELTDAPKRALQVITYDRDPEIQSYADQIRVMLVLAGYDAGTLVKVAPAPPVAPEGVLIVVQNPARAPGFAGAIQNAFKSVGIDALGAKDDDFAVDQAAVVVGKMKSN